MKPSLPALVAALAAVAIAPILTLDACAAGVAGPNGTVAQAMRSVPARPAEARDAPTLDLQRGTLEAVDLGHQRVVLNGRAATLDPGLRVLRSGGSGTLPPSMLRAGQSVRFALKAPGPGAAPTAPRPVIVIFLD